VDSVPWIIVPASVGSRNPHVSESNKNLHDQVYTFADLLLAPSRSFISPLSGLLVVWIHSLVRYVDETTKDPRLSNFIFKSTTINVKYTCSLELGICNRMLKIGKLSFPNPKFLLKIQSSHTVCALSPPWRIVDWTLTTSKDSHVIDQGTKQSTGDICNPRTPNPPRMVFSEKMSTPSRHDGNKSRTKVSCAIETTIKRPAISFKLDLLGINNRTHTLQYYTQVQGSQS
jgi:hypothetical protein